MAGEVVGTAFVRIKALTSGLAKDIENQVKKGMKDADLDKIGEGAGKELGENLGTESMDSAKKTIKKKSKGIFEDVTDEAEQASQEINEHLSDSVPGDLGQKLSASISDGIDFRGIRSRFVANNRGIVSDMDRLFRQGNGFNPLEITAGSEDEFKAVVRRSFGDVERQFDDFKARINLGFPALGRGAGIDFYDEFSGQFLDRFEDDFKPRINLGFRALGQSAGLQFSGGLRNAINVSSRAIGPGGSGGGGGGGRGGGGGGASDDDEILRRNTLGATIAKLGESLRGFGGSSSLLDLIPKKIALIGAAIVGALPYIQDIGAAILAYATGLVAQIGFVVTALGGIGVAAGAALGSSLTIALPLVLAFKAPTEALGLFKDALNATEEEFVRIGTATQVTLFPALEQALFIIEDLVQPLSEFGLFAGQAAGNFAVLFANILTGEEAGGRFQEILQSSLRVFELLGPTIINVGNILSGIWVAAIPASERLVTTIRDLTGRWAEMVTEGLRTGSIVDTFDLWYDRAETLFSALGNLSGALFDILQIGANSSDDVFSRFDEWAERYRDFTESEAGQNRIALIFDNALAVMREVNGVAADLFDGIFGRLGEVGGVDSLVEALQNFREVLPGIQESFQNMLGPIKEVVEFLLDNFEGKLGQAVEELAEPLGRLAFQILDLLETMDESGAFEIFLDLLRIMTDVLSTLLAIPGFATFIGYIIAFGGALKVAQLAFGPFTKGLGLLVVGLGNLIKASTGKALAEGAGAISRFVAAFQGAAAARAAGATFSAASATVTAGATGMAGSLGAGAGALGALGVALPIAGVALAVGGALFYNHQQKVKAWEQEIRQATEALGTLNGGLLITAEGITEYIRESSRFDSRNQEDDIKRLGFSIEGLAGQVAAGTLSYQEFAQAALDAGEISFSAVNTNTNQNVDLSAIESIEKLGAMYDLTETQLEDLSAGQEVWSDGIRITASENDDLLRSFDELHRVIGGGIQESVGDFVSNELNQELLGGEFLARYADLIERGTEEQAIEIQNIALDRLGRAAREAADGIQHIPEETRRQIEAQTAHITDARARAVAELELLRAEETRIFHGIVADFELFNSVEFAQDFGPARQAVIDFSDTFASMGANIEPFDSVHALGLDTLLAVYPQVGDATLNLFNQLSNLPEDEFNAAATAMGADAEDLRVAMEGTMNAIADLQEAALASLPTVASLLDEATSTEEDGAQTFDSEGFLQATQERIAETNAFSDNIATVRRQSGEEAARIAAQEGPAAAAALATLTGTEATQLQEVLVGMEAAEAALSTQIERELGPGIATQFGIAANLIGSDTTIGLSRGLNTPVARAALTEAGEDVAQAVARQLNFTFVYTPFGMRAVRVAPRGDSNPGTIRPDSAFSEGGYVGDDPTFGGPSGTDTVNAWLTPGEFVLRRSIAQAIPKNVLTGLNEGDPHMLSLFSSLDRTRPAGIGALTAGDTLTTNRSRAGSAFSAGAVQIDARGANPAEIYDHFQARIGWEIGARGDE